MEKLTVRISEHVEGRLRVVVFSYPHGPRIGAIDLSLLADEIEVIDERPEPEREV